MTDLAWKGYHPRAAVPQLAMASAASLFLLIGRWYQNDLSYLADWVGTLAVYATVFAVWPGLLAVLLYRAITYTYRLTDGAVLIDRGFLFRPEPPAWLTDVVSVSGGEHWFGRRLSVGWVRVETKSGRAIYLSGVRDPIEFAAAVKEAVERARAGNVTAAPTE